VASAAYLGTEAVGTQGLLTARGARLVGRVIGVAAIVLVGLAGATKLLDLWAFAASLESWSLIPDWGKSVAVGFVPLSEMLIGGAVLLSARRRLAAWAALALLAVFMTVYAAHVIFAEPPDCNCFGELGRYSAAMDSAWGVLIRNAVLAAAIGLGLFCGLGKQTPGQPR